MFLVLNSCIIDNNEMSSITIRKIIFETKIGDMDFDPNLESEDSDETKAFQRAKDLYEEGHSIDSSKIFLKLIRDYSHEPHVWDYHQWVGFCFNKTAQYEIAAKHLKMAYDSPNVDKMDDGFSYLQIREYLGRALFQLGDFSEALSVIDEAEEYFRFYEDESSKVNFRITKGRIYLFNEMYDSAVQEFNSGLDLCRNIETIPELIPLINYQLGKTYYNADNQEMASKYYDRVDLNNLYHEFHSSFHLDKMLHLLRIKSYRKVIEKFHTIKDTELPDNDLAGFYNTIGIAHYYLGNYESAIEAFKESDKHVPDPEWIPESNAEFIHLIKKWTFNPFIWLKTRKQVELNFSKIVKVLDSVYALFILLGLYVIPVRVLTDGYLFCSYFWSKVFVYSYALFGVILYVVRFRSYPQAVRRLVDRSEIHLFYPADVLSLKFAITHKRIFILAIFIAVTIEAIRRYACSSL